MFANKTNKINAVLQSTFGDKVSHRTILNSQLTSALNPNKYSQRQIAEVTSSPEQLLMVVVQARIDEARNISPAEIEIAMKKIIPSKFVSMYNYHLSVHCILEIVPNSPEHYELVKNLNDIVMGDGTITTFNIVKHEDFLGVVKQHVNVPAQRIKLRKFKGNLVLAVRYRGSEELTDNIAHIIEQFHHVNITSRDKDGYRLIRVRDQTSISDMQYLLDLINMMGGLENSFIELQFNNRRYDMIMEWFNGV